MTPRDRHWWPRRRRPGRSEQSVASGPAPDVAGPSSATGGDLDSASDQEFHGAGDALKEIIASYASRQTGSGETAKPPSQDGLHVELVDAELLVGGRPGIVDAVALVGERMVHLPVGLRAPTEEARYLPDMEDPVLGLFEDSEGVAVAVDALSDAELCALLLRAVTGRQADPALVRQLRTDKGSVTLVVEEQIAFSVFTELASGPRLGIELLMALDRVGFNHIAAPLALWRRSGRELGIVQEFLPGASIGWVVALTSVRDLYASGGPPELAGGDFGGEARRLGTMTARMHLGLDGAFGRVPCDVTTWADALASRVQTLAPGLLERPDVSELLDALRSITAPCHAIRTHGDYHLGRVYRNEQGWYVGDLDPGGRPSTLAGTVPQPPGSSDEPVFRSPLADVADMLWSFGQVAHSAAEERDPTGREGLVELADAWEQHNRAAFLEGYLAVPGVSDLVPEDKDVVRVLASAFELERRAKSIADKPRVRGGRARGR